MDRYWADSTGRRNSIDFSTFEDLVEGFRGRFPAERLAGPRVEGMSDRHEFAGTVLAEVGAFREILSQQAVCVLVRPALPRALRIAEIDLQAGIDLQPGVLGHLGTLIPSERLAQMRGKARDRPRDGIAHC